MGRGRGDQESPPSTRRRDSPVDMKNLAVDERSRGTQQKRDGIRHIVLVAEST
jgi:hypothetical protein